MKITFKGIIKYVSVTALTILLLYIAFKEVNWGEFVEHIKGCNYWWIAASMFVGFISTLSRGFRWRVMMLPINKQLTRLECYDAYAICYLANLAFPRFGEVARCGVLADTKKVTFEESFGNMMVERTWDLIITILLAILMVFLTPFGNFIIEKMWEPMKEGSSLIWILLLGALIVITIAFFVVVFLNENTLNKTKLGRKFHGFIIGLKTGIKSTFKMSAKEQIIFYFHTIFIQVCYWLQVLFIFYAFEPFNTMTGMDALFIMIVGGLGWLIPVQGGFGAYHGLITLALVPVYGVTYETGLVFATISHESQIVQMIICGILSLISVAIAKSRRAKAANN